MTYADRYREELAYFRADLPILTAEKIAARCHTLSLLLTAAVRQGEIAPTEDTQPATSLPGRGVDMYSRRQLNREAALRDCDLAEVRQCRRPQNQGTSQHTGEARLRGESGRRPGLEETD